MSKTQLTLSQIAAQSLGADDTLTDETFDRGLYESVSRVVQQNRLIKAMIRIFGWLNGSVMAFVLIAWAGGFAGKPEIIDDKVIMALIAATITQAGLAFITITRFLFPTTRGAKVDG